MKQVSSPIPAREALGPILLRVRALVYVGLSILLLAGSLTRSMDLTYPAIGFLVAAGIPLLHRDGRRWRRVDIAVVVDILLAAGIWWLLPADPSIPLVLVLWTVAVAAFLCSPRTQSRLLALILVIEMAKWPIAATLAAGRLAPESFFRDAFDGEWAIHAVLLIGRVGIVVATSILFRSIALSFRASQVTVEESEVRYRSLVESSPNAILVVQDGIVRFANPSAPDLFGVESTAALEGQSIMRFIPSADHGMSRDVIEETLTGGTVRRLVDRELIRTDGAHRYVDLTLARTRFQGAVAAQVVVQDVTRRRETADAVAETEERYRRFFERLPVALYRTAPDGRIIDANAEAVHLLGVDDRESLVDHPADSFYLDTTDRSAFSEAIRRDGFVIGKEVAMRRASGETMWVRDSARIVDTASGPVYEGALIDVTDRKRAENEVRRRAIQQEAVARIGHLALTGAALDEVFEAAADTMARQLDAEVTGVLCELADGSFALHAGTGWPDGMAGNLIVPPGEASHHRFVVESADPVLSPDLHKERRFTPYAALLDQGVTAGSSVKIPGAYNPIGTLGAFRLVPEPFTADDVHFMESLANIVGAAIQQHEASNRLEELVRSKDQFVASVSHEVRTPLTVVSGLAQELHERWDDFDPDEVHELVGLLVSQSRDMADLIDDLLVSARADIGRVEIRPELVKLGVHIAAVLEPFSAEDAGRIEFAPTDVTALADPARLRQIIRNLLSNALRYGGPNIRIAASNGGGDAVLEVRDDGPEIDQDQQEQIFDAYHRAHERQGRTRSVGLGLTVSRALAEMMSGSLTYEHDGSSIFRLTLPAG